MIRSVQLFFNTLILVLITSFVHANKNSPEIRSIGFGITKEQALNNAFRDAIKQYIGVVLDSEIILANDTIIKDQILTLSNGSIESYEIIKESREDDLIEIEIIAIVKSQNIQQKLATLITAKKKVSINKNAIANTLTKHQNLNDQRALLNKYISDFLNYGYYNFITLDIVDMKFHENMLKETILPYTLEYKVGFNMHKYSIAVKELKEKLALLGMKRHKNYIINANLISDDFPYNNLSRKECTAGSLCLITVEFTSDKKLVYDLWVLKVDNKDSYPPKIVFNLEEYDLSYEHDYLLRKEDKSSLNIFYSIDNNDVLLDTGVIHNIIKDHRLSYIDDNNFKSQIPYLMRTSIASRAIIFPFFPQVIPGTGTYKPMDGIHQKIDGVIDINNITNFDDISVSLKLELQ